MGSLEPTQSPSNNSTGQFNSPDSRPLQAARQDKSDAVDTQVIEVGAGVGRDKWREIGRKLNCTEDELIEYDEQIRKLKERLYRILYDWTCKDASATTDQLLDVCDQVQIGGIVRREVHQAIEAKTGNQLCCLL
jgi:hypothetical protein